MESISKMGKPVQYAFTFINPRHSPPPSDVKERGDTCACSAACDFKSCCQQLSFAGINGRDKVLDSNHYSCCHLSSGNNSESLSEHNHCWSCGCGSSSHTIRRIHKKALGDSRFLFLLSQEADGVLLQSLENEATYPTLIWSSKVEDTEFVGQNRVYCRGIYRERKSVVPPDAWLSGKPGASTQRPTWLLIGYRSFDKSVEGSMESTWKEWSGARYVYLNIRQDFEIRRISFLNRVLPKDHLELFMYVVLIEIGNVDHNNILWLLDFVQRSRVEIMKGFISVYTEIDLNVPANATNDQ